MLNNGGVTVAKMTLLPFSETIIADGATNLSSSDPTGSGGSSGGDAAFGWAGSTAQLDDITVTTDTTYDFGTRAEASQQWWQVGDLAWDKDGPVVLLEASRADGDVLTTANTSVFDTMQGGVVARRGAKAGLRSNLAYESSVKSAVLGRFTVLPQGTPTVNRMAAWGFTSRFNEDLRLVRVSSYSVTGGTFADGDNTDFVLGEAITGVKGDTVTAFTGNIINFDAVNGVIAFTVNGSYVSADNVGATIEGVDSLATATFDGVIYRSPSSMKLSRCSTDPGSPLPTAPALTAGFTHTGLGQHITVLDNTDVDYDERPNGQAVGGSTWEDWSYDADWTHNTDYKVQSTRGGSTFNYTNTNPTLEDLSNVTYEMVQNLLCFDWAVEAFNNLFSRMKDPWASTERARVILGNNAVFANCTKTSTFRSNSWSATAISTKINWAEFTQGEEGFLFVKTNAGVIVNATAGRSMGAAP